MSGPGVVHSLPGLANAQVNCWPMLLIGGSHHLEENHRGAFQESPASHLQMVSPYVKFSATPTSLSHFDFCLARAFSACINGRPGAAYLELSETLLTQPITSNELAPTISKTFPFSMIPQKSLAHSSAVSHATHAIMNSVRPLIVIGKGCSYSAGETQVQELIEKYKIPFLTTPMGKGVVSDAHSLNVSAARSTALQSSDLIILLGARLNWMMRFGEALSTTAAIIQIDICAEELSTLHQRIAEARQKKASSNPTTSLTDTQSKSSGTCIPLCGDIAEVLQQLLDELDLQSQNPNKMSKKIETLRNTHWISQLQHSVAKAQANLEKKIAHEVGHSRPQNLATSLFSEHPTTERHISERPSFSSSPKVESPAASPKYEVELYNDLQPCSHTPNRSHLEHSEAIFDAEVRNFQSDATVEPWMTYFNAIGAVSRALSPCVTNTSPSASSVFCPLIYKDQYNIFVSEGANTMDMSRLMVPSSRPRARLNAGTFAAMGPALGYLIASAIVCQSNFPQTRKHKFSRFRYYDPNKACVGLLGDSSFGFSAIEIETAARYRLPLVILIINNNGVYSGAEENVGEFIHNPYISRPSSPNSYDPNSSESNAPMIEMDARAASQTSSRVEFDPRKLQRLGLELPVTALSTTTAYDTMAVALGAHPMSCTIMTPAEIEMKVRRALKIAVQDRLPVVLNILIKPEGNSSKLSSSAAFFKSSTPKASL